MNFETKQNCNSYTSGPVIGETGPGQQGPGKKTPSFPAETGTIPYNPYIFDPSVLPVFPDEDAIPAEKIAEDAVSLAASYCSRLTEDDLKKCQIIVSQYVKPDKDVYLFSITGTWVVSFLNDEDSIAWLYVDAHTGIPNYFYIISDGISYIGEPGVEAVHD